SARRRLLPAAIRLFPACDPRCVTHRSRIINDTLISLDRLVVSGATLPGLASALIPPGRFPWETPNSHVGERDETEAKQAAGRDRVFPGGECGRPRGQRCCTGPGGRRVTGPADPYQPGRGHRHRYAHPEPD